MTNGTPGGEQTRDRPILDVRGLTKSFAARRRVGRATGAAPAVDDVSFEIPASETVALVGESGSGKTTTGRMLVRLLDPTAGSIIFDGEDVAAAQGRRLRRYRRNVQMVFQNPYSALNPRRSIGSSIALPLIANKFRLSGEQRIRLVRDGLRRVGLDPDLANRRPRELSGGQQQRAVIARAVITKPKLLIADEPVSALDVSTQGEILNLLMDLQRELQMAMLLITHDLNVAYHIATDIVVLRNGIIVESGDAEEVLTHPREEYTSLLVDSAPELGPTTESLH